MPADYFAALINSTHDKAEAQKAKWEANRDSEVDMYKKVALAPPGEVTDEQRENAGKKIDQLLNLDKKGGGAWHPLATHLNQVSGAMSASQNGGASNNQTPGTSGASTGGTPQAGTPQGAPAQPGGGSAPTSPLKQGFAEKAIKKIGQGLGVAGQVGGALLGGERMPSLPPLDASDFSGITPDAAKSATLQAQMKDREKLIQQGATPAEADAAVGWKVPNATGGVFRKGSDVQGTRIPANAKDVNGEPITDPSGKLLQGKPTDMWYPMTNKDMTVWYPAAVRDYFTVIGNRKYRVDPYSGNFYDGEDNIAGNIANLGPVSLGATSTHEVAGVDTRPGHEGEPIAIPLQASRTPVTSGAPGASPTGAAPGKTPPPSAHPATLPAITPKKGTTKTASAAPPGKAPRSLPGMTTGQFNTASKGALGVTEAYKALVGDTPGKPGGLLAQLDVFDHPAEVDALSDYFTAQNQFMEQEAKLNQGSVTDYIIGLPNYLTGLKSSELASKYNALDEKGKAYVDAFTRAIGTAPGLRAVSSSSTAMAALRTIEREYPNPQFVKSKKNAEARVRNLTNEIKAAGTFNPLLRNQGVGNALPSLDDTTPPPATKPKNAQEYLQNLGVPSGG